MDITKSRFRVQQEIPTFVGDALATNQFLESRRIPSMDGKNQLRKDKNLMLSLRAQGSCLICAESERSNLGFLADQETRQVVNCSAQLDDFGRWNLPNYLV
ncbi:MAG: hypothetical protein EB116_21115, partial [Betaproteobacteria bacterium]|nr:hypothetical protein [Betaproteobacteria bacterium]